MMSGVGAHMPTKRCRAAAPIASTPKRGCPAVRARLPGRHCGLLLRALETHAQVAKRFEQFPPENLCRTTRTAVSPAMMWMSNSSPTWSARPEGDAVHVARSDGDVHAPGTPGAIHNGSDRFNERSLHKSSHTQLTRGTCNRMPCNDLEQRRATADERVRLPPAPFKGA
jgi:hypothetical protein